MPITPSPLRYPGGKTAYSAMLKQLILENNLEECDYVEPFAGGAGAAITLLQSGAVGKIHLNDLDYAIYAFWKAILNHTDEFIALIRNKRISIAEWRRQREVYFSDETDILTRGFATFFLNRCNRSGILAANPIGGIKQRSEHTLNARFKKGALIGKIKLIAEMRSKITLSNQDARFFLENYRATNPRTLIYFDPPYYQKGGLLYMNFFTHEDHRILSERIMNCPYAWMLSYDDTPEIRSFYRGGRIYTKGLRYTVTKPSIGMELIISNMSMSDSLMKIHGVEHAN